MLGIVFKPSCEERKDEKVYCDQFGYSTVKTFCVVIFVLSVQTMILMMMVHMSLQEDQGEHHDLPTDY